MNKNLGQAKIKKNDEFYTGLADIENELKNYKNYFEDKVVYCNCDDPNWSSFYKFFKLNFDHYKLKKLITTHYSKDIENDKAYKIEHSKDNGEIKTTLNKDGDFRSQECVELLNFVA